MFLLEAYCQLNAILSGSKTFKSVEGDSLSAIGFSHAIIEVV